MALKLANNAVGHLASSITSSTTSISLGSGEGARFPSLTSGEWFPAVIANESAQEIIKVTARSGDTLTVTRGQEGTTAIAFSANDRVELRITKAALDALSPFNDSSATKDLSMANYKLDGLSAVTFGSSGGAGASSGSITINWGSANHFVQQEPTGTITYTFTAPASNCHLQLLIQSDGTSTAQTINFPASVKWIGTTWTPVANKAAIINFYYDGTSYWAMGSNQV